MRLDTVGAIIDRLGGTSAVARRMGRSAQAVSNWRTKNRFPAVTFLKLSAELRDKQIEIVPALWGLNELEDAQ